MNEDDPQQKAMLAELRQLTNKVFDVRDSGGEPSREDMERIAELQITLGRAEELPPGEVDDDDDDDPEVNLAIEQDEEPTI